MPDPGATQLPALSPRARAVLDAITGAIERKGYPPSMAEIGAAVGLKSLSTVTFHLGTLARKGYIRRDPRRPRAIVILSVPTEEAAE